MAHKIVVTFDDGAAQVKVEGVAGQGCRALTKDLESALGKTTETKSTSEAFQQQQASQGVRR